jgi:hypothetical protein
VPVIWGFIKPPWHSSARNLRIPKTYTPWRCQKSEDSQNLHGMYVPEIWGFAKSTWHAWARNLRIHKAYTACMCQRSFLHKGWPRRNQFAEKRNECITSKPCIVITATFLTLCNREQLQATTTKNSSLSLGLSLSLCLSASRLSKTLFFYNFPVFPSIISSVRVCKLGFEVLSLSPPLASRQWECCCLHGWQLLKRSNCWSSLDRFCVGFLEVCAARGLSLPLSLSQSISCSRFFSLNRSLSLSLSQIERPKARHYKFWMRFVFLRYNACAILQQHRESLGTEGGVLME